jgi:hypothetical protein
MIYDHRDPSKFSLADCKEAVGGRAALEMGGEIIDAGESPSGPYVKFKVDENYGLAQDVYVVDLDMLRTGPRDPVKRPSILSTFLLGMLLYYAFFVMDGAGQAVGGIIAGLYIADWVDFLIGWPIQRKYYGKVKDHG